MPISTSRVADDQPIAPAEQPLDQLAPPMARHVVQAGPHARQVGRKRLHVRMRTQSACRTELDPVAHRDEPLGRALRLGWSAPMVGRELDRLERADAKRHAGGADRRRKGRLILL